MATIRKDIAKVPPVAAVAGRPTLRLRTSSVLALAVAMTAGGLLMARTPDGGAPGGSSTETATAAWPNAQRATLIGGLPGGTAFLPVHFLDARTAVGTAAGPGGRSRRLVVRHADGTIRELRNLSANRGRAYGSFTSSGRQLVWVETAADSRPRIWAADLADLTSPVKQLTGDVGAAVFSGSQYDLLINGGRVFWAAVPDGSDVTQVRSVSLAGGSVSVRTEKGVWSLSAWPWLTDGRDGTSVVRLRDPSTGRDIEVDSGTGTELLTCSPTWCRVLIMSAGGVNRIELMHHDGSNRTVVASGPAGVIGPDVAVLDRFEPRYETRISSGQDTTVLLVYDIAAGRTVEISSAVRGAVYRAGMLWWSTGDGSSVAWHTLDLRTV